jgi:methionine-rich copper-binding protein CopC
MNRSVTEKAISSSPSITGTYTWSAGDTILTLDPNADLAQKTKYTMTIGKSAKSKAGVELGSNYQFSFETIAIILIPPTVKSTSPAADSKDVPLDTKIAITFDKAMDKSATQAAISSSPSILWSTAWSNGDVTITLTPTAILQSNKTYTISIATTAKSADGASLASEYKFSFTTVYKDITPPTVISSMPANGSKDVAISSKITITFSETMSRASVESAVSITPGSFTKKEWGNSDKILTLTANLEEGKTYIVTISMAAKDLAGN